MGKRGVFVLFLVLFSICFISAIDLTGDVALTGKVTSYNLSIGITLTGAPPVLNLILPENKTYLYNESLPLNFTSSASDFWYNLDNGANVSISGNSSFNVTEGQHLLNLYANNSGSISKESVYFTSNLSLLTIYYSEFNGSTRGDSTDFVKIPYEDTGAVSDVTLEHTSHGKIVMNDTVNLVSDEDSFDYILDLDSGINISDNRIFVNETQLPNFEKNATLYIRGLSFSNPQVLVDGSVCSDCAEISYSSGVFVFSVTRLGGVYTVRETPTTPKPKTPGGGGGGGGGATPVVQQGFSVSIDEMKVSLKQGGVTSEFFSVSSLQDSEIEISVSSNLQDFIRVKEEEFTLGARETKLVLLDVFALENVQSDLYLGKIFVESSSQKVEIPVVIEVNPKEALFDVKVEIPSQFQVVYPGEEVFAQITIIEMGDLDKTDFVIDYYIKNFDGDVLLQDSEMIAIDTKVIFLKEFNLPETTCPEKYIFEVDVSYDGKKAIGSAIFDVKIKRRIIIIFVIVILLIIFLIWFILYKKRKNEKKNKKKSKINLLKNPLGKKLVLIKKKGSKKYRKKSSKKK